MHTSAYAHLGVKNEKLAQAVAGLQYVPNVIENLIYHYTAVSKRNKATTMALVRLSLRRVTGPFGSIARAKVAPSLKACPFYTSDAPDEKRVLDRGCALLPYHKIRHTI